MLTLNHLHVRLLEEFALEVDGWLPLLPEVHLPRLTGQMLPLLVVLMVGVGGSLRVFPVSWYDELARILAKVEDLLDAYIVMIPKTDGYAIPRGQRPLRVLPVIYRVWASARMGQLEDWFRSWVPDWVFSAGADRGVMQLL